MRKRLNPVANPEENPENIQATLNISPRWFYSFGLTALQFWFTLTQAEKMLLKSIQCDLSSTSYSRQTDTPNISNKAKNTTKCFYIASNVFINLQLFIILKFLLLVLFCPASASVREMLAVRVAIYSL